MYTIVFLLINLQIYRFFDGFKDLKFINIIYILYVIIYMYI